MYTKAFFEKLYHYNQKTTAEMIQLIEENPKAYTERAQVLISHTLNAHHIWNHRLLHKEIVLGVWQNHPIQSLQHINEENYILSLAILEKETYSAVLSYKDSSGTAHQKEIGTILFHIINHSTYHRGQLMSELKQQGVTPIQLDYVFLED